MTDNPHAVTHESSPGVDPSNAESGLGLPCSPWTARIGALLALIVLLAGFMRFADLQNCPAGLFRDEAEKGYNAWALTTSGGALDFSGGVGTGPAIEWRRFPWMINVMGGKTSAIYQYASMPFMRAGGLSVATTRMASALIGTLTVGMIGLLLVRLWGVGPGLASAAWLALCPWHLMFSRWALEGIFVPFFLTLTLAGLAGFERGRRCGLPLAGAGLGWLFYSYSGAQPFVLAWGFCLLLLYGRRIGPCGLIAWPCLVGLTLFLIPVIPTLLVRLEPGGSTRLARIAIWSDPGITPLQVIVRFFTNYFAHFDPRFLFLSGDKLPRHAIPGVGQLLLVDAVLLPLGLVVSLRRKMPIAGALLAAFLCAPIPAAITREGIPHALRSFAMVVPAVAWSGLGVAVAARWIVDRAALKSVAPGRASLLAGAFVAACLLVGVNDFTRYWRLYHADPMVRVSFEAGKREAWEKLAREKQPAQRVFINGYIPYMNYYQLFFFKPSPTQVPQDTLEKGGFVYFDPQRTPQPYIQSRMAQGDWFFMIADASKVPDPLGEGPLLTPQEASRAGELWVWVRQKN